jgi:hypothetical protein
MIAEVFGNFMLSLRSLFKKEFDMKSAELYVAKVQRDIGKV